MATAVDQSLTGLSALAPTIRGSNQNPDVYMQNLESANKYYEALPGVVEQIMEEVSAVTGRNLGLFRYHGDANPEHIVVQMGSAVKTTESVVDGFNAKVLILFADTFLH